eukprot:s1120_g2.t1
MSLYLSKWSLASLAAAGLVVARQKMLHAAIRRGATLWGPRWLAIGLGEMLRRVAYMMGVQFESDTIEKWQKDPEKRLDPNRQYLTCWHPHGAFTFGAVFFTSKMSAESTTDLAQGPRNWFVGIATLLFRFPLLGREYLALVNARPVTQSMLLSKGRSVALQPGGLPEQIMTDHRKEHLVFPPNLGFCRLALKHGIDLLPIYAFGENQVFTTYQKWGRPIPMPAAIAADPEDALVHRIFAQYLLALADLFQEHAASCLPEEVAQQGLHVVWRGHTKEKLDELLASTPAVALRERQWRSCEGHHGEKTWRQLWKPDGLVGSLPFWAVNTAVERTLCRRWVTWESSMDLISDQRRVLMRREMQRAEEIRATTAAGQECIKSVKEAVADLQKKVPQKVTTEFSDLRVRLLQLEAEVISPLEEFCNWSPDKEVSATDRLPPSMVSSLTDRKLVTDDFLAEVSMLKRIESMRSSNSRRGSSSKLSSWSGSESQMELDWATPGLGSRDFKEDAGADKRELFSIFSIILVLLL